MLLPGYDVAKAAQAAAYFALKSGGKINVLKLSKLLYLAEREFMQRYDEPMFYDHLVSLPDGPVVSVTLNLINGNAEHETWQRFISARKGYDIAAQEGISAKSLDSLSAADTEILEYLWKRFGGFDKYELRDWTHVTENVPEWEDPKGSSSAIPATRVFKRMGKSDPKSLAAQIDDHRNLVKALANG
jgi:uncharacterized phage-associated protein